MHNCRRRHSEGAAVLANLDEDIGDLVSGLGVAVLGESTSVLEGVGSPLTAHILDTGDEHAEAVVVLDLGGGVFAEIWEVGIEEIIGELTGGELSLKSLHVLGGTSHHDSLVENVEIVVTGVDVVGLGGGRVHGVVVEGAGLTNELLSHGLDVERVGGGESALEVADDLRLEGHVTELADWGHVGEGLDGVVLDLDGLNGDVIGLSVLHPVDGEEIAEAAADVMAIDVSIGAAVGAPGGLAGVGGSHGVDTGVRGEVGEHGSGLASLEVEDELLEHAVVLGLLEGCVKLIGVDPVRGAVWGADETDTTVIGEEDEDTGLRVGAEDGTSTSVVTEEDVEEVGLVDGRASVVNLRGVVDVPASDARGGGLVEKLAWERVPVAVCNIVISHVDDLLTGDAVLEHDLDGVMGVSLMAVVAVGVGASHDHSPVVAGAVSGSEASKGGKSERFHLK